MPSYGSIASSIPLSAWIAPGNHHVVKSFTKKTKNGANHTEKDIEKGLKEEPTAVNTSSSTCNVTLSSSKSSSSLSSLSPVPSTVLLFGLSANPPTGKNGHAGIVNFLAAQNQWDEIWVMPVYKHMHGKNSLLINFEDRFQMCCLNFLPSKVNGGIAMESSSRTRIRVVRLEKEVFDHHMSSLLARDNTGRHSHPENVRVGTIDVVCYAQELLPDAHFSLTLGTDTYDDIKKGKWKRGTELLEKVSVVVVSRPGVKYTKHEEEEDLTDGKITFFNVDTLSNVSSTVVRRSRDLTVLKKALEPEVLDYIRKNGLYAIGRAEAENRVIVKRRIGWMMVTGLVVVGLVVVYQKCGIKDVQRSLKAFLKATRRLLRIEKSL